MSDHTNSSILKGIQNGDHHITKKFYKKNLPVLKKYMLRNSGNEDDVYDIFQDALLILLQKPALSLDQTQYSIHSYFFGICRNLWRKKLRENKKLISSPTFLEDIPYQGNDLISEIHYIEKQQLYLTHFRKLNPSNQRVLHLFFSGKTMREIASTMGYTEAYVRKKKFEIKKKLLSMIEKDPKYSKLFSSNHKVEVALVK